MNDQNSEMPAEEECIMCGGRVEHNDCNICDECGEEGLTGDEFNIDEFIDDEFFIGGDDHKDEWE